MADYTKIWTNDSGWTAGVGTCVPSTFGAEAAIVLPGDESYTARSITSTVDDAQWGNTATASFKFAFANVNANPGNNAIFGWRAHSVFFNGGASAIKLQGSTVLATIPWVFANWFNEQPYEWVARGTATDIRFAVRYISDGTWLKTDGTFGAGFSWAFDYTLSAPAAATQTFLFYSVSNSPVRIGTFRAGPAGTPIATPNPATVLPSASVTITPSTFDGVETTGTVTSGGGSYAAGSYTAPGSAGPATLRFEAVHHPGQTLDVPITVGAGTNATGFTITPATASKTVGDAMTITATLTGGTALSAPLVITLIDSLSSTISGTITINNGSTTGTATVTPLVEGTHAITATHAGGGFAGGNGSTSFSAVADVQSQVYVSFITGNDSNLGTIGSPLKTVAAAISATAAGGTIAFRGGDVWDELITLNSSTGARDLIAYATGFPRFVGNGPRFSATDVSGITLDGLEFQDTGTASLTVNFAGTSSTRHSGGITVINCLIHGGALPLTMTGPSANTGGFNGIVIRDNEVHTGTGLGIYLCESGSTANFPHFSNVLIEGNHVHDISGTVATGSGIVLGNVDSTTGTGAARCIIRNNRIHDCGAETSISAGAGGIFPIYSSDVLVQGNVVYNIFTSSTGNDGCGIDLDQSTIDCVVERNYCYDCEGAGVLLFECGPATVRWNVVANCGLSTFGTLAGIRIDTFSPCTVHNNTIYNKGPLNGALWITSATNTRYKKIFNNIFITAPGVPVFKLPAPLGIGFQMEGNSYQTSNGVFSAQVGGDITDGVYSGGTTVTTLAALRTADAKYEPSGRGFISSAPFAAFGGTIPALTDPAAIPNMTAFDLDPSHPLYEAGLDLLTLFSVNPGASDIHGTAVAVPYSVGAVATTAAVVPTATTYTLTGPTSGTVGVSSAVFTVTPNDMYSGSVTITPSGGGLGGPIVLTWLNSATPRTFTITPTLTGVVTLTPTNNGGLINQGAKTYTSVAADPGPALGQTLTAGDLTAIGNAVVAALVAYTGGIPAKMVAIVDSTTAAANFKADMLAPPAEIPSPAENAAAITSVAAAPNLDLLGAIQVMLAMAGQRVTGFPTVTPEGATLQTYNITLGGEAMPEPTFTTGHTTLTAKVKGLNRPEVNTITLHRADPES